MFRVVFEDTFFIQKYKCNCYVFELYNKFTATKISIKMKNLFLLACCLLICTLSFPQEMGHKESEVAISKHIDGTLLVPEQGAKTLAIIIGGSGPTDRNGNQNFLKTNNLKKLAVGLAENGIATFRYDKRVVKQIRKGALDPNIMFDDFAKDAMDVIKFFRAENTFEKIFILGHSQGSLVGILASMDSVDGLVSIAGAGQSIDKVIIEQIQKTAPMLASEAERVFSVLKKGKTTKDYPPALASIFDTDLQPFMANWMKYDPAEELKKLDIPVLVVNGTKDLQVSVEEAKLLNDAAKHSEFVLIEKMNHVLFIIEGDDQENAKSYNDHAGKVSEALITAVSAFINK